MWQAQYETTIDVPAEKLFAVISDINNWNKWDSELEYAKIEGIAKQGASFVLKPKGGPNVKMFIEEFQPPSRFVDVSHLLLAKMLITHEFIQSGNQTTVRVVIEVWGLLGFLWRKIVGERQIQGAAAQTALFVAYARAHS